MAYFRSYPKSSSPTSEDFIYNSWTVGFNTGYKHTANTKVIFKAILEDMFSPGSYGQAFGARNNSRFNNAFGLFHRFNNARRYCFYRTGYEVTGDIPGTSGSTSSPFSNVICIFTAEGDHISWYPENDSTNVHHIYATGANVDAGIAPLAIFCCNTSDRVDGWYPTDYGAMRLYWFEIYESDVLIHRFIPAYNNEQYCLYDEIEHIYIYDIVSSGLYMMGVVSGAQVSTTSTPSLMMSMMSPVTSEEEPESSEESNTSELIEPNIEEIEQEGDN